MAENSIEDAAAAATDTVEQSTSETLWQINIHPADDRNDRLGQSAASLCKDVGIDDVCILAARGFLVQGTLSQAEARRIAEEILADGVVEKFAVGIAGAAALNETTKNTDQLFYVLPKVGVTDPEAETAKLAVGELGIPVTHVRTFTRYVVEANDQSILPRIGNLLANASIEQLIEGPLVMSEIQLGQPYEFTIAHVPILNADDEQLEQISKHRQLSLTLVEMQTIQTHFRRLQREPTDAELETVAQTWSEHCSHKTLAGKIDYTDEHRQQRFDNMLKETIFAATMRIRESLGDDDWCVSVFEDNAGIVTFDDQHNVAFKVETHNRPSAIEPYGGANTGIGGVIRDTLGTGLGAKPICNTDVFCFAPPTTDHQDLPPGVLHPRRVINGVVAGVRDYGNRMGIPTVNGAVYFDQRYIGNPLVFCGNVGLLPKDKSFKQPQANDLIVTIGGRTGRDGIHGATFSSVELTDKSEVESGGAVQIGNAITEKMVMDVLLQTRDENLYSAVTDCGAGGFSSAVGEMGESIGAEVWLEKAPLKYEGLSYTEIWISEAQERMVFAVPEANWERFEQVCAKENVEAVVIGKFVPGGQLKLKYNDQLVADVSMEFLHDGRPRVVRQATYTPPAIEKIPTEQFDGDYKEDLLKILGSLNVASKHWIIRQYDHEVQGGSVLKPLVGVQNDGPGDAAVVRPVLSSQRGLAISCGMNPYYGDLDPYHMAASGIDEAMRNCVAVGADPNRIAILDNFCWGYTDRPETLGALVRAAIACHDVSTVYKTPFISGKDSLNNEFSYTDSAGQRQTISIPSTLLISAMGQVDDVTHCVSMDLKSPGNALYLIGRTGEHLGGSHWSVVRGISGGNVPVVDADFNRQTYLNLHSAIKQSLIRSCHDLSEGGLAVALAEMAFAGQWGATVDIDNGELSKQHAHPVVPLFSESNGRFVCEVETENQAAFETLMQDRCQLLGRVEDSNHLEIRRGDQSLLKADLDLLKEAWQKPLDWS